MDPLFLLTRTPIVYCRAGPRVCQCIVAIPSRHECLLFPVHPAVWTDPKLTIKHAKINRTVLANTNQTPLCHVPDSGQDDRGLKRLFVNKAATSSPQPGSACSGQTVCAA